jgi:hypothetical protein
MSELFDSYYEIGSKYLVKKYPVSKKSDSGRIMECTGYVECPWKNCRPTCNAYKLWDGETKPNEENNRRCGHWGSDFLFKKVSTKSETIADRIKRIEQQIREEVYGQG